MQKSKRWLRVIASSIFAALGLIAFIVGSAHAQSFLINLGSALLASVVAKLSGAGFFLVQSRDLKIECTGLELNEGKVTSSTDASGKVTFTGCVSYSLGGGFILENCILKSLGSITAEALVLPVVHGGSTYLLFEPIGESFTTISYKAGAGCVLPLNNPLTGSFVARVSELDAVIQSLSVTIAMQLLVGDALNFGFAQAHTHAVVWAELAGLHSGQKLGVH